MYRPGPEPSSDRWPPPPGDPYVVSAAFGGACGGVVHPERGAVSGPGVHEGGRARRSRGPLLLVFAATLALCAAGLIARSWRAAQASHPQLEGEVRVEGLGASLVIRRDRRGVPHVEAESEQDAYFGLGFAHAQDRPSQMLWWRRIARGRLAEVAGAGALEADRRARLLGIGLHADQTFERMPRRSRALLEAYAAGANARFARIEAGEVGAPRGLESWGVPIEPWRAADCLALVKLQAWGLGGALDESLVLSDLIERLGALEARLFFPRAVGTEAFAGGTSSLEARTPPPSELLPDVAAGLGRGPGRSWLPLRRRAGLLGASVGSSAWVVGGRHTRSGGTLLVADAHFAPTLPAAYYEAHLRGGGLDVAGATTPGVPVFWTGFNPHVAWATTHAGAVVTDLYVESLHPSDPARYHDGRRWRSLRVREEEIRVRGAGAEVLTVRETRHGPLVNPLLDHEREPLALRWTGAEPSRGLDALLRVARADGGVSLRRVLARHHEPVLAVVYADAAGDAGVQVAGYVPRRRQPASLLPAPGRDAAYGWEGRVAHADLPARSLEQGQGFLVAADALLAEPESPPLEWLWHPGGRAARAEQLLAEATQRGRLDLRAVTALQLDAHSQGAGALLDAVFAAAEADDPGAEEALRRLRAWDLAARPESSGAAVYHLFLERLLRELFAERLGKPLFERYLGLGRVNPTRLAVEVVEGAGTGPWADRGAVGRAIRTSLRDVEYRLPVELGVNREKWAWGRLHRLRFEPLWPGGGLRSLGPFAYGGDANSLLAAEHAPLESFAPHTAPTYRLGIDTAALDEALTSLAPGQSEHPRHPHLDDALSRWLAGRSSLLATSPLAVEDGAVARLTLVPAAARSAAAGP